MTEFVAELLKKIKKNTLPEVASVCVFPKYASIVKDGLSKHPLKRLSWELVFPLLNLFMEVKIASVKRPLPPGRMKSMWFSPWGIFWERNYERVYEELAAIREACKGVY